LIKFGDTHAKSGHVVRLGTNKVMFMPIESWKNNMLKIQMSLVIATELQARHLSFRLRNSRNTPFVGKSVIIGVLGQFQ
jgi:hypothetical protein